MTSHRSPLAAIPVGYPINTLHGGRERSLDLRQIFQFLLKSWLPIIGSAAVFAMIAAAYALTTPPTYTSSTQLMLNLGQNSGPNGSSSGAEEALMEGQIEVAQSNNVLSAVISDQQLLEDSEFAESGPSVVGSLRQLINQITDDPGAAVPAAPAGKDTRLSQEDAAAGAAAPNDADAATLGPRAKDRVMAALRKQIWVRRVGQSPVIEIAVSSTSAIKSAAIANAFAEKYISHNVAMKSSAAKLYANWLFEQVAILQTQVFEAERAVNAFRATGAPADQYRLAELDAVAETTRDLYKSYLQKAAETRQQVSNPLSDATVLSAATVPIGKSHPRSGMIVALALVLGAGVGMTGAIIRNVVKREITSADRVRTETGVASVSLIRRFRKTLFHRSKYPFPALNDQASVSSRNRFFQNDMKELRASIDGMRRMREAKIIGFVGAERSVGTTTIAYNLAWLWGKAGARTILVDANSDGATLSQTMRDDGLPGLSELLDGTAPPAAALSPLTETLTFLSVGAKDEVTPSARISSMRTACDLSDIGSQFDLVIIDLPAMSESADARAIAPHLDALILVARYGKTPLDAVTNAVNSFQEIGTDPIGIVVNQAPSGS
ncbi:Wzz/FepE/Etk N-terminal domain-containing protein [Fulvimarina sp. MAC3]|uniref:Wzz/FepE/Etk N-terminal domain-containing protein n=1 Tax=Fulvimarina sp. MAC3 TaxID=3148887 RepID=UPI0031FD7A7C